MAKVTFVKSARKDYPDIGVKKGESYYWWSFRFGGKHYSKTYPKGSQLTQSEFTSSYLEAQEGIAGSLADFNNGGEVSDLISCLEEAKDNIEQLQSDCEDKVSNLESAFSGGSPTIDLLQERAEACSSTMDSIEEAISTLKDLKTQHEDRDENNFEVDDKVTYHGKEWTVSDVGNLDPTTGAPCIEIKADDDENLTMRVVPSMLPEDDPLERVENEDWRSEVDDAVNGIDWSAE